jgi:hypothetical protein
MMHMEIQKKYSRGFISGMMLFGIALMVAVIGAMALANRDTAGSSAAETAKANAAAILKEGSTLNDGVGRFLADGNSVSGLDFTTAALFDSTKSYAIQQSVPATAFDAATAAPGVAMGNRTWFLHKDFSMPGVGTATGDQVILIPGIAQETCLRINNMLWSTNMTDAPAFDASGSALIANALAGTKQGAGASGAQTTVALTGTTVIGKDAGGSDVTLAGKPSACVKFAAGELVYVAAVVQN